jgi:hypothetical protein
VVPVVAEVTGPVARASLPQDFSGDEIRRVLEMVVLRRVQRGLVQENSAEWLSAVLSKLIFVDVTTLREFVRVAPTLNQILGQHSLHRLHDTTVSEMMQEVVLMIEWPGEGAESDAS